MTKISGIWLMLFSALGHSSKAIFVKLAYVHGVDPVTLLTLRMLMSAPFFVVTLILVPPSKISLEEKKSLDLPLLIIIGLLGYYSSSLLDFQGLQYITASLERIILYTFPTIATLLSFLIFKSKVTRDHWYALAITYFGLILSFISELSLTQENVTLGTLYVLACSVSFALFYLGAERLIKVFGSIRFSSYTMLVSTAAIVAHFCITRDIELLYQSKEVLLLSLGMSVISTVLPIFFLAAAIQKIGSHVAAIVSTIGPILTIVLAAVVLGEKISPMQCVGALFVIGGVLLTK